MPIPALAPQTLTTATQSSPFVKNPQDPYSILELSGTYTGAQFTIEGTADANPSSSSAWFKVGNVDKATGAYNQGGTTLSPADGAANVAIAWDVYSPGCTALRVNVSAITGGNFIVGVRSGYLAGAPVMLSPQQSSQTLTGNLAVTGTYAGTSTSASALTVGANGATNPVIKVDASTASVATGLQLKGAAAAGGVALAAISSGANESMTVDAKGTGTIKLNSVGGTGLVQIGGAASGNNATGLTIAPNAAGSGVALAVVSTGANENLTENAKGSGTITIGGVSTGLVSIGRGSLSGLIQSSTKTTINAQNGTPTAAQLLGGYLDHNSQTGAGTLTLDTAANIDTAIPGVATGDYFACTYVNRGNQTVTITTNTGLTLRGTAAVPTLKNAVLEFFRTGTATYDVAITLSA